MALKPELPSKLLLQKESRLKNYNGLREVNKASLYEQRSYKWFIGN